MSETPRRPLTAPGAPSSVLRGRALVTGGTSGLGLEFARALAARGLSLVLVARNPERLEKTADQLRWRYGVEVETLVADLATRDDVDAVAARLSDDASPVDVLVNNAGHGVHVPLLAEDLTEHHRSLDVMVRAVLVLGNAAGRSMVTRGHGAIINVASVAGRVPMGAYSAIKSWVDTYSESLSIELAGTGVQATSLLPGWVRTEFHERAQIRTTAIPDFLWLEADSVVAAALDDVERGKVRSVPSKRFGVLAFLAAHAPRPVVRRATAMIRGGRS
ncbi:SDR family NAD(P)-dependent oxidoreductase [Georgenia sp. H159]|uniref:SDR family NAD(P)-dependent oxidoreductase n=1 Tax=Georgenia sp. H159 TaxID=3076115 RepID=UPI002D765153|nr:SDR family NAD(P)-dependent oxidoreductase [Georgenia sp. H159]